MLQILTMYKQCLSFTYYCLLYKWQTMFSSIFHSQKWVMFSVLSDTEEGSLWDLWAFDWVQQKAECLRFCIGRSVTPAAQLPVSTDIEYEFGSRNPYNFLQVTYYKVSYSSGCHDILIIAYSSLLPMDLHVLLFQSGI